MSTRSRIVVQDEADGPLRIAEVRQPAPGPHHVLVRIISSGVCQSQIFWMHQNRQAPMLFGHEGYGIAAAVGAGVSGIKEGDHVLVTWVPRLDPAGRAPEKGTAPLDGTVQAISPNVYTWADYTVVDELYVRVLPASAHRDVVAIVACAVLTGAGAVINAAGVQPGSEVAVFGAGGVGLSAIAAASIAGAARIVAVDIADEKLDLARRFGATDAVNARRDDPAAAIHRLCPPRCGCGSGADVSFDCVGSPETTLQGLESVRSGILGASRGGTCVVVGVAKQPVTLDLFKLMATEKTLLGSLGGSCRQDQMDIFIEWFVGGQLDLDTLVTDRFDLGSIDTAVGRLARGEIMGRALVLTE